MHISSTNALFVKIKEARKQFNSTVLLEYYNTEFQKEELRSFCQGICNSYGNYFCENFSSIIKIWRSNNGRGKGMDPFHVSKGIVFVAKGSLMENVNRKVDIFVEMFASISCE